MAHTIYDVVTRKSDLIRAALRSVRRREHPNNKIGAPLSVLVDPQLDLGEGARGMFMEDGGSSRLTGDALTSGAGGGG